jgi:Cof subfamily protein (haloacid dehalogenase superfamily)
MQYRLIGIDLDGTLLNREGRVSERNRAALIAARDAGVRVVPCTGRSWAESRKVIEQLHDIPHGVFVGGAAVSELTTGRSLDIAVIEPHLILELVQHMYDLPEAVLVFRDANLCGHDYLVTGRGSLSANTVWWFEFTQARLEFKRQITLEDAHHAMRVGIVATVKRMREVTASVMRTFGDRVRVLSFEAVQMPDPAESVHVLEIFAAGVDKWRGLQWMADQHGLTAENIAVIGDEINDVAMLQPAGCGIAMGNAIDALKAVAKYHTLDNENDGVAHAIEQLISGRWT